jgi:hypothetical protein
MKPELATVIGRTPNRILHKGRRWEILKGAVGLWPRHLHSLASEFLHYSPHIRMVFDLCSVDPSILVDIKAAHNEIFEVFGGGGLYN